MLERRLGGLAAAVGIAAAMMGPMTGVAASASSRARSHRPAVVRPRFRSVGTAAWVWTGGRYALSGPWVPPPGPVPYSPATLIDDHSGQVKTIDRAGCYPVDPSAVEPLDLAWVPFNCAPFSDEPAPELYSPETGQWRVVAPSPGLAPVCGSEGCSSYALAAAGRYWLAYDKSSCDIGDEHCSPSNVFQNIQTGEVRPDPSGGSIEADLNAPDLTRTVCAPLKVPTTVEAYARGPVPGSLTFYGSFALAIGSNGNGSEAYLERCGTHLHRLLARGPFEVGSQVVAANTHEVVWSAHRRFLNGLTLPGLRPFTIRLPHRLVGPACSPTDNGTCVRQIALTGRRLYLLSTGLPPKVLWATASPPPAKRHRR